MSVRKYTRRILLLELCILPQLVFAEGIKLLECVGSLCEIPVANNGGLGVMFTYLNALYPIILGMAGATTILMGLWGGIQWTTAGGDPGKASTGRTRLLTSVAGLIMLLMIPAILNLINPTFFV